MSLAVVSDTPITWAGLDLRWAYSDLLRNIYARTRCIQTAYDVLHDSMLRFALSKNHAGLKEPHAYMRVVVRNLLTDTHLEKSRFVSFDKDDELSDWHLDYCAPSPEQLADLQQRMEAIQSIINCLPPKCREVFWLFRIEGVSQTEIALQLNISVNMVERHVIRALVDIRAARELLQGL